MTSISKSVVAVILGGGAGSRLYPLTASRSKPAVPIAGKYRLVDIPISNCINSHINRMFVLTQFNSASLNKHIKNTYHFSAFSTGFVDILAAEQTPDNPGWFQGTADAVRQSLRHISNLEFELSENGQHFFDGGALTNLLRLPSLKSSVLKPKSSFINNEQKGAKIIEIGNYEKVNGAYNLWYKVEIDNVTGWIFGGLCTVCPDPN